MNEFSLILSMFLHMVILTGDLSKVYKVLGP